MAGALTPKAINLLPLQPRKTMAFTYGFMLTFIVCTVFIMFYSPGAILHLKTSSFFSNRSHFSSSLSQFFLNISNTCITPTSQDSTALRFSSARRVGPRNTSSFSAHSSSNNIKHRPHSITTVSNLTQIVSPLMSDASEKMKGSLNNESSVHKTQTSPRQANTRSQNWQWSKDTSHGDANETRNSTSPLSANITRKDTEGKMERENEENHLYESMLNCNIFDGKWVRDDSFPLYAPGSCPHIDEPFNCFLNGRPDRGYESYRWLPHHCNIPRLDGKHMLNLLRGKRLVFVGDSLNRNMWESLVCILRNSVDNKSRVFEASGRQEFRTEGSYSFIFEDYNCSVEFFRSPFLVQEWEIPDTNGSKKETLRLDLVERSSDRYKDADILIFNTGHWWTHDKTSKGRNYYQEGSHVYSELDVTEAFRRAITTWSRWVDAHVTPMKTQVFFRGYSSSHFGGGEWNTGGRCDKETEPFKSEKHLLNYPPKMQVLEHVIKWMKTPVFYLNITRMTNYRKDGHPSIYRAQHLSEEERQSPLSFQDCSHWCLPGVPDTWNELVYAQVLINQYSKQKQKRAPLRTTQEGLCSYIRRMPELFMLLVTSCQWLN
ncbi:hypothetical protein Nepgr_013357 [Nepenthes gracilis]|uniref:Trichome birefringence-like N-terminal domain-containing protein n=1 Tax=Nepenthes gracilis TaxID=150966 RepID=A0AAD3SJF2_NEPGR|nr:hypothetical protein Nepgr_013357 [Nepenthes gracilis]